jgi:nucleotide-binding universal stress UspA family protein
MSVFKHVLAATDLSDASAPALELAVSLAREAGARLTVVHACEIPVFPEGIPPVDWVTPVTAAAGARLDALVGGLRGRVGEARAVLEVGAPWEVILAAAAKAGADLVVVGTHGRRGLAHAMLGSVAERVVRLSPVPVLTVRSPGR